MNNKKLNLLGCILVTWVLCALGITLFIASTHAMNLLLTSFTIITGGCFIICGLYYAYESYEEFNSLRK
jgi:phosphoglycerol transferase MdoB-like AlkP superfamily enzyme